MDNRRLTLSVDDTDLEHVIRLLYMGVVREYCPVKEFERALNGVDLTIPLVIVEYNQLHRIATISAPSSAFRAAGLFT